MTVSMSDHELERLRRNGFGVAYRMLGSVSESEDVAQEALLRLTGQEGPIDEPAAWITTVATRLSINVLRSARARREAYVGPWLPEPLLEDPAPGPAARAELADSLSLALLVLLEQLNPVERAAYLLREVFGYEYAQIAEIIERTEVNARQLVTRARKRLEAGRASTPTRPPATPCSTGSSPPPRRATWRRSSSCSPRTRSSTPTAAARRWPRVSRSAAPGSTRASWPRWPKGRPLRAGSRRAGCGSTASPAACCGARPSNRSVRPSGSRPRGRWRA